MSCWAAVLAVIPAWVAGLGCSSDPGSEESMNMAGAAVASAGSGGETASNAGSGGALAAGSGGAAGASGSAGADGIGGASGGMAGTSAGGSAGNGGAGGAPEPMLTLPIERDGLFVLEFGDRLFAVDGAQGARIVTFGLDGTNVLTGPDNNPDFFGSTFWTSPESDWSSNPFMAVPAVDSEPYTMTVEEMSAIVGESAAFTVNGKQVSVGKRFSVDLATQKVVIEYSITNQGNAPIQIGHWEVTRVPADGLSFYPTGAALQSLFGAMDVVQMAGADWFDHAEYPNGVASKIGADAGAGWIAHVIPDPAGDLLLLKEFPDIANAAVAPGAHEVEIFAQNDRSYVELEMHGSYETIAPQATAGWTVRWSLLRLPAGTEVAIGSTALLDAVSAALE